MSVTTRIASNADLPFLCEVDRHVSHQVQADLVSHGRVLTSTVSAERAQHLYRRLGYVDSGALFLPDEPTEIILRKPLVK